MKKSIFLLIAVLLILICLASCNSIFKHEHIADEYWSFNEHQHWKNIKCNWLCEINIVSYDHIDDNGDLRCDVCGYNFGHQGREFYYVSDYDGHCAHMIGESCDGNCQKSPHENRDADMFCDICGYLMPTDHEHTYDYYRDEIGHSWSYTCGCETPPNFAQHYDGDGDNKCDGCDWYMLADGNHFIRNQAGAEWLNDVSAENITEIKMISGGGGPLPPVSFTYISSSTDKAVISNIFEEYYWLDSTPVPEDRTQIADGGYVVVQFILNDGTVKRLNFINGEFYSDGKGNYFELVRLPVFQDGTNFVNYYGFEIWEQESCVYLEDGLLVAVIPTKELEFTELMADIDLGGSTPTHYIEMNGVKIYFLSEYYFYINDDRSNYYRLVGKTLYELIAENAILYD